MRKIKTLAILLILSSFFLISCGGWDPQSTREVPVSGTERAKKNIREGRGVSLADLTKGRGSTTYEFSSSNPMWRAAFDVIDFMPLTTVDYSGGTIITDWYSDNKSPNESLKFTIRFLSSEVRADSVKIIIHKKTCRQVSDCSVKKISSKLENEIRKAIIKKAALLDKENKNEKKKNVKNKNKKKKGWFNLGERASPEELRELDKKNKRESGK